ncbi:ROK family protein [Pedobacter yonginense]|nr:ROK family protein [Pedobacter yonginense]
MEEHISLGVDIGGTHITAALVDVKAGTVIPETTKRSKIDSNASASQIVFDWCKVIAQTIQGTNYSGKMAIAMPGPFDYENGISHMTGMGKYESLYEQNVRSLMLQQLGQKISRIDFFNDAACFLQGELAYGEASAHQKVFGLTLGTGFGTALGTAGVAKDADYWRHPFMGGICEDFFSSKWFTSQYEKCAGRAVKNVKDLIDHIEVANPLLQVFDEFSINLSTFLSRIHKKDQFSCVVIGGNISNASSLFLPQLKYHLQSMNTPVSIYISSKGEDAALIGAANSI